MQPAQLQPTCSSAPFLRSLSEPSARDAPPEKLNAPAHSIPSTYIGKDGKQYIAVPAGGGGFLRSPTSDEVIAWRIQ